MKHDELREAVARAIFEHWQFQGRMAGTMAGANPVLWVGGGNSFKQDEARDYADAALAVIREAVKEPTPEMMEAISALDQWCSIHNMGAPPTAEAVWETMHAASPLYPEK